MNPIKSALSDVLLNLKLKWSGKQKDVYDFAEMIRGLRSILVLIPGDPGYRREAVEFSKNLPEIFPGIKIKTFSKDQLKSEDLNWLGLPNQSFLNELQIRQYGMVIDLNPEPDKIYSYICANSASPLRLNISESPFDYIYNLHIRPDTTKPYKIQLNTIRIQLAGLKRN